MKGMNIMYGYKWKVIGMIMSAAGIAALIIQKLTDFTVLQKFNSAQHFNFLLWLTLFGLVTVAFSKEKHEDERVHSIRTKSFMFAFLMMCAPIMAFGLTISLAPNSPDYANGVSLSGDDIVYMGRLIMAYPAVGLVLHLVMFHVGLHFDQSWDYENETWSVRGLWKHKRIRLVAIVVGIIIIELIFRLLE